MPIIQQKPLQNWLFDWGKVFLPARFLRYYPPRFTIREPVVALIRKAFHQNDHVAVIVFHLEQNERSKRYHHDNQDERQEIRAAFKRIVQNEIPQQSLLELNHFLHNHFSLILKIDKGKHYISQIEQYISFVKQALQKEGALQHYTVLTGYMFVDKETATLDEALYHARGQALAMVEKETESQFNEMMFGIDQIIENEAITMLAQPIIDVASTEIKAWEMLTRGPGGTMFESPLQLFSMARQTQQLYELEMIVIKKAFEQLEDTGCRQLIFINLTPMTIGTKQLITDLEELLRYFKAIRPQQIIFEITERDSIDGVKDIIPNVKKLREMGFRIAIDDTGSGYASLHTISQILPDIIKIDRSVISGIDSNEVKESMLQGLLLIAEKTNSLVVAEGIETSAEAAILSHHNVDLAQGFYYARPNSTAKMIPSFS